MEIEKMKFSELETFRVFRVDVNLLRNGHNRYNGREQEKPVSPITGKGLELIKIRPKSDLNLNCADTTYGHLYHCPEDAEVESYKVTQRTYRFELQVTVQAIPEYLTWLDEQMSEPPNWDTLADEELWLEFLGPPDPDDDYLAFEDRMYHYEEFEQVSDAYDKCHPQYEIEVLPASTVKVPIVGVIE